MSEPVNHCVTGKDGGPLGMTGKDGVTGTGGATGSVNVDVRASRAGASGVAGATEI